MLFANMTLFAPNGLRIVMMERFEGLTSAVDCKGDDGEMSLTFSSKEAFDHAVREWNWINLDDSKKFLLIANHDGCGPDAERQAYTVNKVTDVVETLTTVLEAVPAPWKDVAGTYDLDFGKVRAPPAVTRRMLRSRGFGDFDTSKSSSFKIDVGTPGKVTNLFTDTSGSLQASVNCVNCFLTGNFQLTGRISVENFRAKGLVLTGAPSGVNAALELGTVLKASVEGQSTPIKVSQELVEQAIPGAGFSVPRIITLGAAIEFSVEVTAALNGAVDFTLGLAASLPDSARVTADLRNPSQSSQSGFEGFTITPKFKINSMNGTATVTAAAVPKLTFGIDIAGVGEVGLGLELRIPSVSSSLTATLNEQGACSQDVGASQTGVRVANKIGSSLKAVIDASIISNQPSAAITLFEAERPLSDQCFAIDTGLNVATKSAARLNVAAPNNSTNRAARPT